MFLWCWMRRRAWSMGDMVRSDAVLDSKGQYGDYFPVISSLRRKDLGSHVTDLSRKSEM